MLQTLSVSSLALFLAICASVAILRHRHGRRSVPNAGKAPPALRVAAKLLASEQGHALYNEAFERHGPVVLIPRHGRNEYIIDHRYCQQVLTDSKDFAFDKGVVQILGLEFMLWFKNGTFIQEVDDIAIRIVQNRLEGVLEKILPSLQESVEKFLDSEDGSVSVSEPFQTMQEIIARAMTMLILGPRHCTEAMTKHFVAITIAISQLGSIYENTEGYPWAPWLFRTEMKIRSCYTIAPILVFKILPDLWKTHRQPSEKVSRERFLPAFDLMIERYCNPQQSHLFYFGNFLWSCVMCLALIFASVHQTAVVIVWVIIELTARQDECLSTIREEWEAAVDYDAAGKPKLDLAFFNRLGYLDSFIRETMRLKGDTYGPVRITTRDTQVGEYIIPKGVICMPYVKRIHEHPDNYGPTAGTFNAFRWREQQRPCSQATESFISFGLGRWSCPGRQLAVNEIKAIVYLLFRNFDLHVKEGSFRVTDPMNVTSVAPEAILEIHPRELPLDDHGNGRRKETIVGS